MTNKTDDKYGFDRDSQCCSDWRDCSVYKQLQQANKRIEELEKQADSMNTIIDRLLFHAGLNSKITDAEDFENAYECLDVLSQNEQKLKQIEEKIREYKDDCDDYEGDDSNGYCYGCQGVYCLAKQLTKIIKDGE